MENIKNSINKLGVYKEFGKLKEDGRRVIERLKNMFKNNRFITVASILFVLFSLINVMLILYFIRIINGSVIL